MTQQTEKPCHWCDLPESAHPVYRQIDGEHAYEPRVDEPPIAAPDRPRERPCTCATSDTPAQHHCGPSAQLPPRREDTERARDWPAYQTGRAPVTRQPEPPPAPTMYDLNELVNPPRPRERWWRRILGSST